jgi:protein TonB
VGIFAAQWQKHPRPWKWGAALGLAVLMIFVLSSAMSLLIQPTRIELAHQKAQGMVEFVRIRRAETVQEKRREPPEKPPEVPQPPPQPAVAVENPAPQTPQRMDLPSLDLPLQLDRGTGLAGFYQGSGDGDVVPLVRVEPIYPQLALNRGLEGWVKVGLHITPQGTVRDAEIVDAQPAQLFNRAVIRAVMRWKFKPKIVNGVPVDNYVTQVIQFNLDKK